MNVSERSFDLPDAEASLSANTKVMTDGRIMTPSSPIADLIVRRGKLDSSVTLNPLFMDVLDELTRNPPENLKGSLQNLRRVQQRLHVQVEELAAQHYPLFLAKADASHKALDNMASIVSANQTLLSRLPYLNVCAQEFLTKARELTENMYVNGKALDQHTQLLELLELPQLMETCIQNAHYDDAIAILLHMRKLLSKYAATVPVIQLIAVQVSIVGSRLVHQLCDQLRSPLSLPACIKTVVLLRRTTVFTESQLRFKFLQARTTCLESQLHTSLTTPRLSDRGNNFESSSGAKILSAAHIRASDRAQYEAYWTAARRIEVTRTQLFDIVTQYRSVFSEEDNFLQSTLRNAAGLSPLVSCSTVSPYSANPLHLTGNDSGDKISSSLFHTWLIRQIAIFLDSLADDLQRMLHQPSMRLQELIDCWSVSAVTSSSSVGQNGSVEPIGQDVASLFTQLQTLVSQAMYFGRSFSRIGCDFRPHLADLFNNAILNFTQIYVSNTTAEFTIALDNLLWVYDSLDSSATSKLNESSERMDSISLVQNRLGSFPVLILIYNRYMNLFNGLRCCCPIALKHTLISMLSNGLRSAAKRLVITYRSQVDQHTVNWRSDASRLAMAFGTVLVPCVLSALLGQLLSEPNELPRIDSDSITYSPLVQRLCKIICSPLLAIWPSVLHQSTLKLQVETIDPESKIVISSKQSTPAEAVNGDCKEPCN